MTTKLEYSANTGHFRTSNIIEEGGRAEGFVLICSGRDAELPEQFVDHALALFPELSVPGAAHPSVQAIKQAFVEFSDGYRAGNNGIMERRHRRRVAVFTKSKLK